MHLSEDVAGFVLAGGKSSRMGQDKALMRFRGRPLIEISLATLRTMVDDVKVVGSRQDLAQFAPVVEDQYRDCGPLGGIEAALRTSEKEWNLIFGVDTPLVPPQLLEHLLRRAQATGAEITAPRIEGRNQPLCAVYRRGLHALVQQAIERGDYRVEHIFQGRTLCIVDDAELASIGIAPDAFANLNTLEEFAAAEQAYREGGEKA